MITRVFVSDVHMSPGFSLDQKPGRYDWLTRDEATSFNDFLNFIVADYSIDELILLGDMMDLWIYPIDIQPATYSQIVEAKHNQPILETLRKLAQNKKVIYVQGNHDMSIMEDSFAELRNICFKGISFQSSYETPDGVLAEHGHQFNMYNAQTMEYPLPIGYFLSRLSATVEQRTDKRCRLLEILKDLDLSNPLVDWPIDYLAEQLDGVNDSTAIITADGKKITLGEVRELYADLPETWEDRYGFLDSMEGILSEAVGLAQFAQWKAEEEKKKLIVFGHTHDKCITYLESNEDEGPPRRIGIYANCGAWCDGKHGTYIVDKFDAERGQHKVKLRHWPRIKRIALLDSALYSAQIA